MKFTNRDAKFVDLAIKEAEKSELRAHVGCVAVVSGKVAAKGHNNYRTYSKDGLIQETCSCHAEIDALRKCYKQNIMKKINLYSKNKVDSFKENFRYSIFITIYF